MNDVLTWQVCVHTPVAEINKRGAVSASTALNQDRGLLQLLSVRVHVNTGSRGMPGRARSGCL